LPTQLDWLAYHNDACTQLSPGFDLRNIWWNPKDSKLQANGYNGIGYASLNLDADKYIAGDFTYVKQVWLGGGGFVFGVFFCGTN
jgi:hypothetical protein